MKEIGLYMFEQKPTTIPFLPFEIIRLWLFLLKYGWAT